MNANNVSASAADRLLAACRAGNGKLIRRILDEERPDIHPKHGVPIKALLDGLRGRLQEEESEGGRAFFRKEYADAARQLLRDPHFGRKFAAARAGIGYAGPMGSGGALHDAARACSPELIEVLVEAGMDTEAGGDTITGTALHVAVQHADVPTCEALLAAGSNPFAHDQEGETPIGLSEMEHVDSRIHALMKQVRNERVDMDHYGPGAKRTPAPAPDAEAGM